MYFYLKIEYYLLKALKTLMDVFAVEVKVED